jgi:hypothetical protein
MKKQLLATFFGVTVVFNALAYLGPNDKMAKWEVENFAKQLPESSYVSLAESYRREYTESLASAEKKLTALKAEVRESAEDIGGRAGENIMPVYLSMQNPLILDQRQKCFEFSCETLPNFHIKGLK